MGLVTQVYRALRPLCAVTDNQATLWDALIAELEEHERRITVLEEQLKKQQDDGR